MAPLIISQYFSIKYLLISKTISSLAQDIQKIDFGRSIWGILGVAPPSYVKITICILNLNGKQKRFLAFAIQKIILEGQILGEVSGMAVSPYYIKFSF